MITTTTLPTPLPPSQMHYPASPAAAPPEDSMPRPLFADPKTDFAFKRIFGSAEHESVLIAFLNAMLGLEPPYLITTAELLPPEQRPVVDALKFSIVDVKCTDARGITYVVEMQVLATEGFAKRVVYNAAKAYVNQAPRGQLYPSLGDVVGITICDFVLFPDKDDCKVPMLSRWRMVEEQTGAKGLDHLRLVFLELPKYDASRPPQTMVEKWAYFFREAGDLRMIPDVLSEPPFLEALEAARTARFTLPEWDAYIFAGMAIQNERGVHEAARKLGRTEGRAHGLREAIEMQCSILGIELNPERTAELAALDTAALTARLRRTIEHRGW